MISHSCGGLSCLPSKTSVQRHVVMIFIFDPCRGCLHWLGRVVNKRQPSYSTAAPTKRQRMDDVRIPPGQSESSFRPVAPGEGVGRDGHRSTSIGTPTPAEARLRNAERMLIRATPHIWRWKHLIAAARLPADGT